MGLDERLTPRKREEVAQIAQGIAADIMQAHLIYGRLDEMEHGAAGHDSPPAPPENAPPAQPEAPPATPGAEGAGPYSNRG